MFARIIYIGTFEDPSERDWRLAETLESMGHAVRRCPAEPEELAAAIEAFRPTLILWGSNRRSDDKERCLDTLAAFERCQACAFPESSQLTPGTAALRDAAPDRRYQEAIGSDPDKPRDGVLIEQTRTRARMKELASLELDRTEGSLHGLRPVLAHDSWEYPVHEGSSEASEAFRRRYCRYALFFGGDDAPGTWELSRAMAEGALVLAEEGALQATDDTLRNAVPSWTPGGLRSLVEQLEGGDATWEKAWQEQQASLRGRPTLDKAAAGFLNELDEAQREAGKPPVLACGTPAQQVTLFGWFGAQNYGDDLLMGMAAQRILDRLPNGQVAIIGADPQRIRRTWGYEAFSPDQKGPISSVLRRSIALACCGGLIFDDPLAQTAGELEFCLDPWIEPTGQAALALLARSYGVPAIYLGAGAGPVRNPATQRAAFLTGLAGTRFLMRDKESCQWLLDAGVPAEQVALRADLAFDARSYIDARSPSRPDVIVPTAAQEAGYFIVSLRHWHLNPPSFEATVAAAIDDIVERSGRFALFLPFDQADTLIHEAVARHMRYGDQAIVPQERPSEEQLLAAIKGSQGALAMRLHCSILHHVLGKTAVGLNYNDKVESHFLQIGRSDFLLSLQEDATTMAKRLRQALEEGGLDEPCRAALESKRSLVGSAFDELFDVIEHAPSKQDERIVFYPRTISHDRQRAERAEQSIEQMAMRTAKLEEQLRSFQAEAEELRSSRSFRIGHALLTPLATIREAVRKRHLSSRAHEADSHNEFELRTPSER